MKRTALGGPAVMSMTLLVAGAFPASSCAMRMIGSLNVYVSETDRCP